MLENAIFTSLFDFFNLLLQGLHFKVELTKPIENKEKFLEPLQYMCQNKDIWKDTTRSQVACLNIINELGEKALPWFCIDNLFVKEDSKPPAKV